MHPMLASMAFAMQRLDARCLHAALVSTSWCSHFDDDELRPDDSQLKFCFYFSGFFLLLAGLKVLGGDAVNLQR